LNASFPRITYVTDTASVTIEDLYVRVARSVDPVCVLVRDKGLALEARFTLAMEIRAWDAALTLLFSVPEASNLEPTLEWATELGLDGVHFASAAWSPAGARAARQGLQGAFDQPAWVSVACHDPGEAAQRSREGANIVLLSPIFDSPGKGPPLGLSAIREAAGRIEPSAHLVALGGIDGENAGACLAAGAYGVASIRHALSLTGEARA
jgi:thiamine-phosphate pyrophosphorylase